MAKTAEKNSAQTNKQTNKQTDRQTNRHYENNGHLAVNQHSLPWMCLITLSFEACRNFVLMAAFNSIRFNAILNNRLKFIKYWFCTFSYLPYMSRGLM